ncbi:hypothetical protein BC670_3462 [Flavobacterium branchiophilum]|uniref:Uncharacterized protein n=1 Tax=Flavobacterium branchiophilum TaxID=55197 RepID=A0A543G8V4_9FLAO|nr:hypothetical protein BC670_3462 [Flavobacterium branchiophilum]
MASITFKNQRFFGFLDNKQGFSQPDGLGLHAGGGIFSTELH